MKLLTGLFRFARKRTQTVDTDMGAFREKLDELVEKKDSLGDEEIVSRVEELKSMSADLPDGDDKSKLERFLEDFKAVKEQDAATAKEAAKMVADLFESLDTEAMKDTPEVKEEAKVEAEEVPAAEGGEEAKEEAKVEVEETEDPEGKAEDAEPNGNAEYTLEEIYQFIKKRMAEDAAACDGGEEVKEEEEKKEEKVVADGAPVVPITMNARKAPQGSLGEMFNRIKNGGR